MNTLNTQARALAIVLTLASASVLAHGDQTSGTNANSWTPRAVIHTNAAYARAIPDAPNPAPETVAAESAVIYVDLASGPAMHSYAGRTPVKADAPAPAAALCLLTAE